MKPILRGTRGRLLGLALLALGLGACSADSSPATESGGASGSGGKTGTGGGGGGTSGAAGAAGRAGMAGSAGVGGPSLCAGSTYLVCEDFESTAVGGVPTGWTKHGDATVQADQAVRGSHALKIGAAASGERRIYADAAKLGSGHWGRIFYKVQLPAFKPPSGSVVHSTLVAFQGNGPKNGNSEY